MKIIDLYNKIANGEEIPKKIKYKNCIFENRCVIDYWCKKTKTCLDELILMQNLNDEVEIIGKLPRNCETASKSLERIGKGIKMAEDEFLNNTILKKIEEEKKIPEKIKIPEIDDIKNARICHIEYKINEIIDCLNSKGDE